MCCFHVVKLVNKDLRAAWVNITLGLHQQRPAKGDEGLGAAIPRIPSQPGCHILLKNTLQCHQASQGTVPHPCTPALPPQLVPNWEAALRACIKPQQCLCLQRQMLLQGMARLSCASIKAHKKAIVSKVAQNYV